MRKPRTYDRDSDLGRLIADLKKLRKGVGLTHAKVRSAETLCNLGVVRSEARRLKRPRDVVAYALLTATVHRMRTPEYRDLITNAYGLGDAPGKTLADRRRRMGLSEERTREREDEAFEELAGWLMTITNPGASFGDYVAPEYYLPAPTWESDTLTEPTGQDEVHPLGEIVWEQLEKTAVFNEFGHASHTETRGIVRALVDGVTGYTLVFTNQGNPKPQEIQAIIGGTAGKRLKDEAFRGSYAQNINFARPLPIGKTLRLQWIINLPTSPPDAPPENGWAQNVDIPARNFTLRAQFDEQKLPVLACYYLARPRFLARPLTRPQLLDLQPGNLLSQSWPTAEEGKAYVFRWDWPEQLKPAGLT